jgi:3-phosphoshikimate 1-carboxyvinyltransferase
MADALSALGVTVEAERDDWVVAGGALSPPARSIDVGNAGTVARFLPAVAALAHGPVHLDGDPRIRERPLAPLVRALRSLGVQIEASPNDGLPLTIDGGGSVAGGDVELDASASSQLVSGLLLAAPRYDAGVTVRHVGPAMPSTPHLDMTVSMLRTAGAVVETSGVDRWRVLPGTLAPHDWEIEPDLSSAAPFLAAAAATGGRVRIPGWPTETTQPGGRFPALLASMGATTTTDGDALVVSGPDALAGIDADMHSCGELTPVVAALAALATGPTRLSGIAHLRQHETDRLAALVKELNALGSDAQETDDGLIINPRPLHGGLVSTYDDHRMAMAAAVIGLVTPDVVLDDVATTDKTLPGFADLWTGMLDAAEPSN